MDNKSLDLFLSSLGGNLRSSKEADVDEVIEVTKGAFTLTASVPEQSFCESLVELLYMYGANPYPGWWLEDPHDPHNDEQLYIFINPNNLVEDGKIRPDVAFKRGKEIVVFEIDSFQYHSNQKQLTADKVRERKIQALGYPVYRFSAKECLDGHEWGSAVEAYKILIKKGWVVDPEKKHG